MIKKVLLATALVAVAAPAFAGGLAPTPTEPVVAAPAPVAVAPVAAPSADWTGFYVGGQLGFADVDAGTAGTTDGMTYGLHTGYLHDFGSIVAGAELSLDDASDIAVGGTEGEYALGLKARLGYDAGAFLPYLTAGVAQLSTTGAVEDTDEGYTYGIGVDYALTDAWRLGAEVSQAEFEDFAGTGTDISSTNAGLRVSFSF